MTRIFHNPRCTKSRQTLSLLRENGIEPEVVEYLQTPPSREELGKVIRLLGIRPIELVRKGENEYKMYFKGKDLSDEEWLDAMVKYPKLMERPVVIKGSKAVIGRPPEKVLEIL